MGSVANMTKVVELCKRSAARLAVDEHVKSDCIIGIGSGSTMTYVVERVKELIEEHGYKIQCVPTSFQSKQLICEFKLLMTDLTFNPRIDVTIDGADEVDNNLVAIKGGGGCLAQEKVVALAAENFFVVADSRKNSQYLGQAWSKGIPIEVLPMAASPVKQQLSEMLSIKPDNLVLRTAINKAGPVITDNGNFIIDWMFDEHGTKDFTLNQWKELASSIKLVPGVLETGIFAGPIKAAYFGFPDGRVLTRKA